MEKGNLNGIKKKMNKRWKGMKGEGMTSDDTPLRGGHKAI